MYYILVFMWGFCQATNREEVQSKIMALSDLPMQSYDVTSKNLPGPLLFIGVAEI